MNANYALTMVVVAFIACDRAEVRQAAPSTVGSAKISMADTLRAVDTVHAADTVTPAVSSSTAVTTADFDSSGHLHFSSLQDSICGEVAENGFNISAPCT